MTANLEVYQDGAGWVYVVEQIPDVADRQGNSMAALPTTLEKGEIFTYYTAGQDNTLVQITPDEAGKGCLVNADRLEVGQSRVVGNLKITGA